MIQSLKQYEIIPKGVHRSTRVCAKLTSNLTILGGQNFNPSSTRVVDLIGQKSAKVWRVNSKNGQISMIFLLNLAKSHQIL